MNVVLASARLLLVGSFVTLVACNGSSSGGSSEDDTADSRDSLELPELEATVDGTRVTVEWNESDFSDMQFNLCLATETLDAGFENCSSQDGGEYFPDISSPFELEELEAGTTYWLQLEVVNGDGDTELSEIVSLTLVDPSTVEILGEGPFAAIGPYKEGTEVRFFAVDQDTGQRVGSSLAKAAVDERGAFELPTLSVRWVEAEITGEFLNLYSTDGYEEGKELTVTALYDMNDDAQGRNISVFSHWVATRARQLLDTDFSTIGEAYQQATADFVEDFDLEHGPSQVHLFYTPDLPRSRLDDLTKLFILSSLISEHIEDDDRMQEVASAYAEKRFDSEDEDIVRIKERFASSSASYLQRGVNRLGTTFLNEERPTYWVHLSWLLNGCAAAQAFNPDTVICLDDGTVSFDYNIPPGSGFHMNEIFLFPEAAGMWALEVTMEESCRVAWTSYTTATGSNSMGSVNFNSTVDHRLLGTHRITPGLHRLWMRFNRDDCSADQATFNFRKVSTGTDQPNLRGIYFLEPDMPQRGISGAYSHFGTLLRGSTYRSYFFLANLGADRTWELELDYANNGSSGMTVIAERPPGRFGSDFLAIAAEDITDESGRVVRRFDLEADTIYRVQVQNISPRTINLDDYVSYGSYPYTLTATRVTGSSD